MWELLAYLKDYKKECVLAPLFKMLEAMFELAVPLVVSEVIDIGIARRDTGRVVGLCLLMAFFGLVGLAASVTAQYFAAKASVGLGTRLRSLLFEKIQSFSFSDLDQAGASTLITRMTGDVSQVQSGVNLALRLFLRSPFIVFGAAVMAFSVDARAALVFAVAIPLLLLTVFGVMAAGVPLYRKVQERLDAVLLAVRENLSGVRVIRAFHKEDEETEKFREKADSLAAAQTLAGKVSALLNPLTYVIVNLALVAILRTGAARVDAGALTQGELVALVNYMSQILAELIKLANLIITVTKAAACGNRIQDILKMRAGQAGGSAPVAAGSALPVRFSHVSFSYPGASAESLSDLDFSVEAGETVGIIGGTGSGKTSLVHLIPRFYDVTRGEVLVGGRDVREYSLEGLRRSIGIAMQKAALFRGTLRENLCWGRPGATDEELYEALRAAQAMDIVEAKEGKLDAVVEQGGRNFSGGQRQRLALARALVRRPQILILDDCASALDYATEARLRAALRELDYRPTIFFVSQRPSSVRHADQIIVMDDGRIAGKGTHEELLSSCGIYQEICKTRQDAGSP